jgi:hypothetical protein
MTLTLKKFLRLVCALGILVLLFSCNNPLLMLFQQDEGSLKISISSPTAKALLPDLDMTPAGYTVAGSGPGGRNFNENTAALSVTIPVHFGDWTVTVDALNADGVIIGRGQGIVTVHSGQNHSLGIVVVPLDGYGTLDLTVQWTEADVDIPSIEAQLIPPAGAAIDLGFTIQAGGTADYNSSTIPTGYYTLVLKLMDNDILVMGAVETVRIIKDQTTSGQFDFLEINDPPGSITINITPELNDPIDVALSGQVDEIDAGGSMTVTASVPADVGNVVYAWYINGESMTIGDTYTFGSDLDPGIYRLDVTAFSADGSRAGSATHTFNVLEGLLASATLEWDPNTEADLAGYKLYYGYSSRDYDFSVDVGDQTNYTLVNLETDKTYYIAATAYNIAGEESDYSNELIFNPA